MSSGGWNAMHVVEGTVTAGESKCKYKLTSTVTLSLSSAATVTPSLPLGSVFCPRCLLGVKRRGAAGDVEQERPLGEPQSIDGERETLRPARTGAISAPPHRDCRALCSRARQCHLRARASAVYAAVTCACRLRVTRLDAVMQTSEPGPT